MFLYFLWYHPLLNKYKKFLYIAYHISVIFLLVATFIVVFGNLALAVYTKKNIILHAQIIHNLPLIVKILLIHSFWVYVVYLVFAIFALFITPAFARAKNHSVGNILMEVKWQRWRFAGLMYLLLFFGAIGLILFGGLLKMYAFGLALVLVCLWRVLDYIAQNSLRITENGLLIGRIFSDVFIPYDNLYPLSEKEIQEEAEKSIITTQFDKQKEFGIGFECIVKNGFEVRKAFMNLYNEKVKEFRQNYLKDSNAS